MKVNRDAVYQCTNGYNTIGYGHLLLPGESYPNGISQSQANLLFDQDIQISETGCKSIFSNFDSLSIERKTVLVDMAFNLGKKGLQNFKKMIAAIERYDFNQAADEMVDSKWYVQVKLRGIRNVQIMRTSQMP